MECRWHSAGPFEVGFAAVVLPLEVGSTHKSLSYRSRMFQYRDIPLVPLIPALAPDAIPLDSAYGGVAVGMMASMDPWDCGDSKYGRRGSSKGTGLTFEVLRVQGAQGH